MLLDVWSRVRERDRDKERERERVERERERERVCVCVLNVDRANIKLFLPSVKSTEERKL